MATNDPNKPDNVTFIDPGNKTPEEKAAHDQTTPEAGGETPAPEMTAEEAAALAGESEKALRDIGEEQLEPPAPSDMGGEHIPDHDDGLRLTGVTFIKSTAKETEQTTGPDKEPAPPEAPAAEEQAPVKKGRGDAVRPVRERTARKVPGYISGGGTQSKKL